MISGDVFLERFRHLNRSQNVAGMGQCFSLSLLQTFHHRGIFLDCFGIPPEMEKEKMLIDALLFLHYQSGTLFVKAEGQVFAWLLLKKQRGSKGQAKI